MKDTSKLIEQLEALRVEYVLSGVVEFDTNDLKQWNIYVLGHSRALDSAINIIKEQE